MLVDGLKYVWRVLCFNCCDLSSILEAQKTPLYVYSKSKIIENYNKYKDNFDKYVKNYQVCYAVKANFNFKILKMLKKLGSGFDVVSLGEIKQVLKAGVKVSKIVFSGVGKTEEELEYAIKKGIGQINIESYEEFLDIVEIANKIHKIANIAIRINPNIDAHTHEKITTGKEENKFGVNLQIAKKIIEEAKKFEYVKIKGLSFHIGSQITDLKPFEELFNFIKDNNLQDFETLDLGGGIGIQYADNDKTICIEDYTKLIKQYFGDSGCKIIVEPGRSIVADAGIFICKIVRIKRTENKNFIILDGGMNNLIRPAMYGAFHKPFVVKIESDKTEKYDIVGPICESSDVFCENIELNEATKNNYIAFACAGAYGRSMASEYNLHKIAKEIFIK